MNIPSKIVEQAVDEFSSLPSIGKRSALRFVLHLLKQEPEDIEDLAKAILKLKNEIQYCSVCQNISDDSICGICSNPNRDQSLICVVEDVRDVMAIENTLQFKGVYHVLGGLISPMDGIGPNDIKIEELVTKVETSEIKELIFALSATMEGDTTNFYIYKKIEKSNIKTSILSRGVAVGDELAYADELTLGNSIVNRTPFEISLQQR
ncbi:recombination mediator RecR [Flavobacteriales bacterium]|nr:recombination mediator RecR [Flavobacteriales bacterium]MDB4088466.1 recombination mediator RecR [Flavobacteriales bacterium]